MGLGQAIPRESGVLLFGAKGSMGPCFVAFVCFGHGRDRSINLLGVFQC